MRQIIAIALISLSGCASLADPVFDKEAVELLEEAVKDEL